MKKKQILSLAMACALSASLAIPALAADSDPVVAGSYDNEGQTEITGTYKKTEINVLVPQTGTALINPYGLEVNVTKADNTKVPLKGQIVSAPMAIKNQSTMRLNVGASVTGTVKEGSTMKFSPTPVDSSSTTKSAYVQLEAVTVSSITGAEATIGDQIITAAGTDATWTDSKKIIVGTKANDLTTASTDTTPDKVLATLEAATLTGGTFTSYIAKNIALFRLSGSCAMDPKGGWLEDKAADDSTGTPAVVGDGFTVNVAFTFTPAPASGG